MFQKLLNFYWLLHFLLFLFQTVDHVNGQSSYYTDFTTQDDWMLFQDFQVIIQQIVDCPNKNYKFFGGPSNGVIFKTFFLPPHYLLDISFLIGFSSLEQNMRLYVDDHSIDIFQEASDQLYCDNALIVTSQHTGSFQVPHSSRTVQIQIAVPYYNGGYMSDPSISFWISLFSLYIFQCPYQCDSCNVDGECDKWTLMSIYFGEKDILQFEGWLVNNQPYQQSWSCGNFQLFGPFAGQGSIYTVIKLNSIISVDHSEIRIRFKLIIIRQPSGNLRIFVNNVGPKYFYYHSFDNLKLICGHSQTITVIDTHFLHNTPNLLISILLLLDFQIIVII